MPDQDGEKSQEPTQHRRQKAREEGQVARSHDLVSAVLLVLGVALLMMLGRGLADFLTEFTASLLGSDAWLEADPRFAVAVWNATLWALARYVLPIFGVLLLGAIVVNVSQVGFLLLPNKLMPDLSHLDPLKGAQRILSLSNVVRLLFGIFKIVLIAVVAWWCLHGEGDSLLALAALSLPEIAAYFCQSLLWTTMKIGVALLVLALLDYLFQWWKQEQDLRMTTQEVREEMKNLEGDPQVAARRRQVARQLALNRMSSAVPKADAVITNPTELAIAIQFDPETMAAPIVVAKGAGFVAQKIRRIALENGIPIVERKPLAQALFRDVEVNHPIPTELYSAVAEVLRYVYELKGKKLPPRRAG